MTKPDRPAFEHLRLAIEALATGPEPIRVRLQAASRHIEHLAASEMQTRAEQHLHLRIGAGLVEGGDGDDGGTVADSIAALDEARAVEIAGDIVRLYELVAGLRTDDGYVLPD